MGDEDPNDQNTLAKNFAMGLGSLLGANSASSPLKGGAAPAQDSTETPAPPSVPPPMQPRMPQPQQPQQQPPQDSPGLSDNMKMGLIPLLTTLAGGLFGGAKGAQMGAGTGLNSVGAEVQRRDQRDFLQQQKDIQEQRDIDKAVKIDEAKNENRKGLVDYKDDLKPDAAAKTAPYVDDDGNTRTGTRDPKTGLPVQDDSDPIIRKAPKAQPSAEDKAAAKADADQKKSDIKVAHTFANDMNPRKGRAGQFGVLAKKEDAADAVLAVLQDDNGNPVPLTKGNRTEAAAAVASLISNGGTAAEHTIEQMTPASFKGDITDKVNYLFNSADPTEMNEAVTNLINTAKREKKVAQSQIRNGQLQVISDSTVHSWRTRDPAGWARTVKAAGLDPADFDEDSVPIANPSWAKPVASAPGTSASGAPTAPSVAKTVRQNGWDYDLDAKGNVISSRKAP